MIEPPPAPGNPRSRRTLWLAFGIGVSGVIVGVWLVMTLLPRWLGGGPVVTGGSAAAGTDGRKIHATLFYVDSDGGELVPVSREVPLGGTPGEQARRIVEAQLQAAPSGMYSPIPAGTGHTGGSLDEALTVFALVDAVTVNLPDVSGVQVLVDGKEADTLAGHIDLRHPLKRSLKWVKKQ
jgi:hypothetical protein